MRIDKLKYLSLLGLVGLLGLLTGNQGFFGFFGFFGFLGLVSVRIDEFLERNAARAGLNAFIVSTVGLALAVVALSFIPAPEAAALFIAAIFVLQLLTFVFSFHYYEKRADS